MGKIQQNYNVSNDGFAKIKGWHLPRMKKKLTDDNEKPFTVYYRSSVVALFLFFQEVGQLHTFWVNVHWIFFEKLRKIPWKFTLWLRFSKFS